MNTLDNFKKLLKGHGHSITTARVAVFQALYDAQQPLAMKELVKQVASHTDRVSVYRAVALFEQLHIVHRLHIGWKYKIELSDTFLDHHHHMTCLHCGTIATIYEDPIIEQRIAALGKQHGFTLTGHQFEMQGYCTKCHNNTPYKAVS